MLEALLTQSFILQIPLHGVHLGHGVGDGRTRGKNNAATFRQFVQVAALGKQVAGFLGLGLGQPRHVAHLGVEEQVFVKVRLVHEQPVNTQLHNLTYISMSRWIRFKFYVFLKEYLRSHLPTLLSHSALSVLS